MSRAHLDRAKPARRGLAHDASTSRSLVPVVSEGEVCFVPGAVKGLVVGGWERAVSFLANSLP
jgi:hypothetical protein